MHAPTTPRRPALSLRPVAREVGADDAGDAGARPPEARTPGRLRPLRAAPMRWLALLLVPLLVPPAWADDGGAAAEETVDPAILLRRAQRLERRAERLWEEGKHEEAIPRIEQALQGLAKGLGAGTPAYADVLMKWGDRMREKGRYPPARPLYDAALEVYEKSLGPDHPRLARGLNSLGLLLQDQGDCLGAKPLFERARSIYERAFGPEHPAVATTLSNLAAALQDEGDWTGAEPLCRQALGIFEKALGRDHPHVATALNNLAAVLKAQGAYAEAEPLFERALQILERALGHAHPTFALGLNNLAEVLAAEGAVAQARPLYERALAITEAQVKGQMAALSGRQRLELVRSVRYRLDNWLRFAPLVDLSGYPEVLRLRGLVGRAEATERVLARRAQGEERTLLGALTAAQRHSARLANEVPPAREATARANWQRRYAEAAAERERLTRELSQRMAPLQGALERLDLTLADVQRGVGEDEALVDFLRVGDRYPAWVVRRGGEPTRLDLGPAQPIEAACAEFMAAVGRDAPEETGKGLRALVWDPVEGHLGEGVRRVVLCPDLSLAAVPFAALPGRGAGRNLLHDYVLSYVSQAQDLVPGKHPPAPGTGAVLVGGVDYERAGGGPPAVPGSADAVAHLDRAPRGGRFAPLPGTRTEVEGLRRRLGSGGTTVLLGTEATEAGVRAAVPGKRMLHIATHGFAREDLLQGLHERKVGKDWLSADAERQLSVGHDPMLLSALALAGANPRIGGGIDDGILTALEASYLDLDGVELVVLSACETARGTPESGEGVQGLVRAIQMAGARDVVASLWKVDDEATLLLMEGFYERALRAEDPLSPAEALREASLALSDQRDASGQARFASPRYWAAFVCYGRR